MKSTIRTIPSLAALACLILVTGSNQAHSATTTWTNGLADGDINKAGNWSAGLPSDAANRGALVTTTALVIDKAFNNAGDNRSEFLIIGSGGLSITTGASFTYLGDGLLGTTYLGAGAGTITQTGGTLIQDGGGAGFLVGHSAVGTYNISGGNLYVQGVAPTLTINFGASGSSLNISGSGIVDVGSATNLVVKSGGTLDVTGDGLLIWRNRTLDQAVFGGTVNASITQVGNDLHFTAIPEPHAALLGGLGLLALLRRRR